MKKIRKSILGGIILMIISTFCTSMHVFATNFALSPMNQQIILTPGETYYGSFEIVNPATSENNLEFETSVTAYDVDENNTVLLQNKADYSQIVNWIKIQEKEGSVVPNSTEDIHFEINVPKDAPAGGQYAALLVKSKEPTNAEQDGISIQQSMQIAHLLYAEVAGETVRDVTVSDLQLPGFLFGGNLAGTATVKNNGNTHADVSMILQVYPLFSNEEFYTNEEDPRITTVLPGNERYISMEWDKTPSVGIYNVHFSLIVDGEVAGYIDRVVFITPIWLLFVIIFAIIILIIWIILKVRSHGKAKSRASAE